MAGSERMQIVEYHVRKAMKIIYFPESLLVLALQSLTAAVARLWMCITHLISGRVE